MGCGSIMMESVKVRGFGSVPIMRESADLGLMRGCWFDGSWRESFGSSFIFGFNFKCGFWIDNGLVFVDF